MLERADERPRPPFFEIPRSALPRTGPFYLKLRAVNGQGMPSAPVIVGPLAFDDTPPLVSAFTVEREGSSLRVVATGVQDPNRESTR
ncbi:hypothetical protein [Rhodothermus marinus]|uniref:hypothetical protein n=1 Tax=Rhodothermus marinus TaxID=29549 RepID=UPI0006D02D4A|nr:hypothetical protein [Rhodothermus marinus]